jgi:hypothetical protein
MNPQEQRTDLCGERHGGRDAEAEGQDLEYGGTDAGHEDDGEEFVAEFGAGGEVDGPVASVTGTREISVLFRERGVSRKGSRIEIRNLYVCIAEKISNNPVHQR